MYAPRGLRSSRDLIRKGIYDQHSGLMKITTHLDYTSRCKTTAGINWSSRWTHRVSIMNTRPGEIASRHLLEVQQWSHVETQIIHKLGFNQNYYMFAPIFLTKIIMCSKFHWTMFFNHKCFHMRSRVDTRAHTQHLSGCMYGGRVGFSNKALPKVVGMTNDLWLISKHSYLILYNLYLSS